MNSAGGEPKDRKTILYLVGVLLVVAAVHLMSLPRTIWEYDESLFAMAVEDYQPLVHHPPPPGYPIYIAVAKLMQPLFGYVPFRTLVGLSAITAIAGFILLALAFRAVSGSTRVGVAAAFVFYMSPTMLLHATLPQSDSGALMLLAASVWLSVLAIEGRVPVGAMAVACAATIGWRLQFSIAVVPLFLTSVMLLRNWRERLQAVQWFAVACAAWLIALIGTIGSLELFWKWLSGQAAYFAAHDADLSRTGRTAGQIVLRFISHPWGPKWLAAPLLLLAVVGAVDAFRRRMRLLLPLMVMSAIYLGFALVMMDPADGVRYALPGLPTIALLAMIGLDFLRRLSRGVLVEWALVALYAVGAYVFVGPLLRQRVESASPPFAATQYIRSVAPRNAVILYDMPLKPHSEYLLRGYTRMRIHEGLLRYGHRLEVPIYELTDNASDAPHAKVFRWQTPDAYTKLTRGHYGVASVVPLPATHRFQAMSGIFPPERTSTASWRWVGARGTIALPDVRADRVRLTFDGPPDYPLESNRITVSVEGGASQSAVVTRGKKTVVELPVAGAARVDIVPEQTFVPAERNPLNRDRRVLSVMLTSVEQLPRAQPQAVAAGQ